MGERPVQTPEEEIESLLRRQPRRMPSPALWDRLSAGAQHPAWRSTVRLRRLMAVGVTAAVAVTAMWALHLTDKPSAPRPALRPHETKTPSSVAVRSGTALPTQLAQAVPVAGPRAPRHTARSTAHVGGVRPVEHQTVNHQPVMAANTTGPETIGAPPGPVESADQGTAEPVVSGDEGAESSYYLEVTRGNERSVLSGSVTRDNVRGVTEITIAYDPAAREQDGN